MRPLTYAIALGVESGGTEGTRPLQLKSLDGTSPETLVILHFFQNCKKYFEWHIIQLYS